MKPVLLLICLVVSTGLTAQQDEHFVYCINGDSLYIEKVDEVQNGDTVVKTFTSSNERTYVYYIYNDSIFSKYEGMYYIIGANQAQIGDIWNPFWYMPDNSIEDPYCASTRTLEIVAIDVVQINGENRNKYALVIRDELADMGLPNDSIVVHFIEGVGATTGGLYYNFLYETYCYPIYDQVSATFKSYGTDDFEYIEQPKCIPLDFVGVKHVEYQITLSPNPFTDKFFLKGTDAAIVEELYLYNALGQLQPFEWSGDTVKLTEAEAGIYFVSIRYKDGTTGTYKVVKE